MPTGIYKRTEYHSQKQKEGYARAGGAWNKGKKFPQFSNEKSIKWKGNKASYSAFHIWLKVNFGKASKCENPNCIYPRRNSHGVLLNKPSRYEWAKISEEYTRNREDYAQLCPSCHRQYDMGILKLTFKRAERKNGVTADKDGILENVDDLEWEHSQHKTFQKDCSECFKNPPVVGGGQVKN